MLIFGGTFSPVHLGHLHIIHSAILNAEQLGFTKLIIVPAYISPFKENDKNILPFSLRFKLLELSILDYAQIYSKSEARFLELTDIEKRFGCKVCTCELVKYFKKTKNIADDKKISFLAGDDILSSLNRWKDSEYLKKNVNFVICPRFRDEKSFIDRKKEGFSIEYLNSLTRDISSTDIRTNNRFDCLTKSCAEYIKSNSIDLKCN